MALLIRLPKFIKDMLPSIAGVFVGLMILFYLPGQSLPNWFQGEPEPIQKDNYERYFANISSETKVILFGTSWCQYCAKARNYFKTNNIDYIDWDVEQSNEAMKLFKQLKGESYPLILLRGVKIVGFNESAYDDFLKTTESTISF